MSKFANILETVGRTPVVRINKLAPKGINLFSLHAADGTPLALTDTRQAAVGHAIDDDLEIASVH